MSKSKQDDRQEDRAALFPSTRLMVQNSVVLDYGFGTSRNMGTMLR